MSEIHIMHIPKIKKDLGSIRHLNIIEDNLDFYRSETPYYFLNEGSFYRFKAWVLEDIKLANITDKKLIEEINDVLDEIEKEIKDHEEVTLEIW